MRKYLILLLLFFMCNYSIVFADCVENSGPIGGCDVDKKYPYQVCVDGKIKTECLSDPNATNGIIKMNLPICLQYIKSANEAYGFGGWDWYEEELFWTGSPNSIRMDLDIAANKWNCICGSDASNGCGTTIPVKYIWNDPKKFNDPYKDPAGYNIENVCYPSDNTIYINWTNEFTYNNSCVMANESITNEENFSRVITYCQNFKKEVDVYNEKYGIDEDTDYRLYNQIDVVMQQVGKILGMSWNEECSSENSIMSPDAIKQVNDPNPTEETVTETFNATIRIISDFGNDILYGTIMTGKYAGAHITFQVVNEEIRAEGFYEMGESIIEGTVSGQITIGAIINVMGTITLLRYRCTPIPYSGLGGENNDPSGDNDKCMFAKLYCPEISIYDDQPQGYKVFPNPGKHIVTIQFILPKYTDALKMTIKDMLGQTLFIPIENGKFEAGEQSISINIENLSNGIYYTTIEAGTYITAQPLIIAR